MKFSSSRKGKQKKKNLTWSQGTLVQMLPILFLGKLLKLSKFSFLKYNISELDYIASKIPQF